MENDKIFDLMTKMYSEMQKGFNDVYSKMQQGFSDVNGRIDKVDIRLDNMENRLDSVELKIDNIENRLDSVELKISNIENRLDSVEFKIGNIENRLDSVEFKIGNIENRLDSVENKLGNLEFSITKTNVLIEQDIKPKIETLFDGYKQNSEKLNILENKIDDLQIDVNNLSLKTLKNENKFIEFNRHIREVEHRD